ncbi:hypothetical protein [Streptomyces sp. MS191]|uniref:hypothetical protein n=1 Tax=Streptomyces sp. ms191 TaxID=1827978 RepID=UPI00164FB31A|nr:hypothetical protein [Streptomyces sp. ms191]
MTDEPKPESNGRRMTRLIRDTPPKSDRQRMLDNFRRTWAKPTTKKENDDA